MLVISLLTVNTGYMFRNNSETLMQADIEYEAIALAQSLINDVKWENDIDEIDPASGSCICNSYPQTQTVEIGSGSQFEVDYTVDLQSVEENIVGSNVRNFRVTVIVTSDYLPPDQAIQMQFLKNFAN